MMSSYTRLRIMHIITVIVIVCSLETAFANPCIEFACDCQGTVVKCNQKNLVSIPDGIPTTTTELDLSQNSISTIAADAFINLASLELLNLRSNQISSLTANVFNGLVSLKSLDLFRNDISTIAADTFKGLVSLEAIDLRFNKISTITADTFKDLMSLIIIFLSQNEISTLDKDAFTDLGSLEILFLDNNNISSIAIDTFKDLESLKSLYLNNNAFTTVSANIFRPMTNITLLYIDRNPLICCNMTDLIKWIASQSELSDILGTCFDFDAITKITEFHIANCSMQEPSKHDKHGTQRKDTNMKSDTILYKARTWKRNHQQ